MPHPAAEPISAERTAAEPDSIGYTIDFGATGRGHEMLMTGWSYAEDKITWTVGIESVVVFPTVAPEGDYELTIVAHPAGVSVQARHRAIFRINNIFIGGIVIGSRTEATLLVPAQAISTRAPTTLTISVPDAISPAQLSGSGDRRLLSLAFHTLTLKPFVAMPATKDKLPDIADQGALPGGERASDRDIMMNLQSLGVNCELGFAQRTVGAEPLGLFRWANAPLPILIAALTARFEGYGAPDHMEIILDGASEFQVIDKTFGFRNHSFAFASNGATAEAVLKREAIRVPYLARMMIADLEEAAKLFVFHDAGKSSGDDVEELVRAIRQYNPGNMLLWVQPADQMNPAGSAFMAGPGLISGFISHFEPIGNVKTVMIEDWLNVARAAHGIWTQIRPLQATA